ncbi:hypothetical protein ILUMI_16806 [Ignelater luminosus]|uniref:Uncharacterized protein n=1 Tax=Ignelater luminosus TaxID=2038154 RepID=A0A8K0CQA1_IGNLU|nr:hypothetical protein ILUMI_16806 [Ignelater luminosus]
MTENVLEWLQLLPKDQVTIAEALAAVLMWNGYFDQYYIYTNNYEQFPLISDDCNYQNTSRILARALSNLADQKIFQFSSCFSRRDTMIECDSIHATLQEYLIPPINTPSDHVAQMRNARPKQPYHIKVVDYTYFKNFEIVLFGLHSLRSGKKVGEPVVTDMRDTF